MKTILFLVALGLLIGGSVGTVLYARHAAQIAREDGLIKLMLGSGLSQEEAEMVQEATHEYRVIYWTPLHFLWALSGIVYGGVAGLAIGMILYFRRRRHRNQEQVASSS